MYKSKSAVMGIVIKSDLLNLLVAQFLAGNNERTLYITATGIGMGEAFQARIKQLSSENQMMFFVNEEIAS